MANVGDSRAIMCSYSSKFGIDVKQLSVDHKPSLPEEYQRIQANGGRV